MPDPDARPVHITYPTYGGHLPLHIRLQLQGLLYSYGKSAPWVQHSLHLMQNPFAKGKQQLSEEKEIIL